MKKLLIISFCLFLLPVVSQGAITTWQMEDFTILNEDLSDSCVGSRNLGTSVVNDTKLASSVEGRIFLTLYYEGTLCNTAGLGSGIIFKEPANGMSGSLTIERVTVSSFDTMSASCTFVFSCDNGATYDTLTFDINRDSAVLSTFTNFLTWATGKKINIRISKGSTDADEKINIVIQAKYAIKND